MATNEASWIQAFTNQKFDSLSTVSTYAAVSLGFDNVMASGINVNTEI